MEQSDRRPDLGAMKIRDARGPDREAIVAMWRELMAHHRAQDSRFLVAPDGERRYSRHIQEMMRSRDARVLVAETVERSPICGYLVVELQERPPMAMPGVYGFLSDIYVLESARRQGVGRLLFAEAQRWLTVRKAVAIELYVAEANPAAAAFWQALGFDPFLKLMRRETRETGGLGSRGQGTGNRKEEGTENQEPGTGERDASV